MTHICYTLEEASEKLKLSETVLVRLSQYFKVPQAAYEDVGYLSFKGDLAFTEQDIAFFRQAKERLVAGETLDDIKRRIRTYDSPAQWQEVPPLPETSAATAPEMAPAVSHSSYSSPSQQSVHEQEGSYAEDQASNRPTAQYQEHAEPAPTPMREIQDRKPYEQAAEKSFERYKSMHRNSLGKVFENMLREVGAAASRGRNENALPAFRPFRTKPASLGGSRVKQPTQPVAQGSAFLPFGQRHAGAEPRKRETNAIHTDMGHSWGPVIQQAASHPRSLNNQVKSAAISLRERALQEASRQETRLR